MGSYLEIGSLQRYSCSKKVIRMRPNLDDKCSYKKGTFGHKDRHTQGKDTQGEGGHVIGMVHLRSQ